VAGTLAVLDKPAETPGNRLYNLGAARSEDIMTVIALFGEDARPQGRDRAQAVRSLRHAGDRRRDLRHHAGFRLDAQSPGEEGIPLFVDWFKDYNRL